MPQAQAAAKLSTVVGSDAYAHLGATVAALFEGRSHAVALHHALDEVKTGIGLRNFRVVGTGDAGKILRPEGRNDDAANRSEEHTSELQSIMRNSYAVFCLKTKNTYDIHVLENTSKA